MNFNVSNTVQSPQTKLFMVLNDRSQVGASIHDGDLKFINQRRNIFDDKKGLKEGANEVLKDKGVLVRTRHLLYVDTF